MTGTTISSEGLDVRRKRVLYRSWHRGTREMDLIVGRFADAYLATLTDAELDEFEELIEIPDPDLYASLTGTRPMPELAGRAVYIKLKAFHDSGRAVP